LDVKVDQTFIAAPEEIDPENNIIATYYVESEYPTIKAGEQIAIEESIGTWTEVTTETEWIRKKLAAKVFQYENKNEGIVKIAFPLELFDPEIGGIPNLLSMVAGNLFGLSSLKNCKLLDLEMPKEYVKVYPGPKIGLEGVRKIVGTLEDRRPHLGTIIKPKVGLNPDQTAKVAYEAAMGGVDFIKDDETLTSQKFCPFEDRLTKVLEKLDQVREETGRTVLYAVNITATYNKLLELADLAIDNGANCLMIDVLTTGFSAVQVLAEDPSIKVPLHIHRAMHAALTRNPKHGISMMVIAKLVRLAGGDQLHTGTAAGKMGVKGEAKKIRKINDFLRSDWHGLKTVFPVASGGIHPGIVPVNVELLGKDIIINAGGGIHGHPWGTRSGAKAMKQAIEAVTKGISLDEYAKDHPELDAALKKWGQLYVEKAIGDEEQS
jgi:ribulose-bisphosphate carboxylase large chain